MDFYQLKYLKYKNKYYNIKGGGKVEDLTTQVKDLERSIENDKKSIDDFTTSINNDKKTREDLRIKMGKSKRKIDELRINITRGENTLKTLIEELRREEAKVPEFIPTLNATKSGLFEGPLENEVVLFAEDQLIIEPYFPESSPWKNQYKIEGFAGLKLQPELMPDWTNTSSKIYAGENINYFFLPRGRMTVKIRSINQKTGVIIEGKPRQILVRASGH
jgi:hypothetical protein